MKRWLGKLSFSPNIKDRRTFFKLVIILSPALFILLLELLRVTVFKETGLIIWGTLSLVTILVASFFFSRFILAFINHQQEKNEHRMRELAILSDIHQTVDEYHNLKALLNRAMDKLIDITAADAGELYLVNDQSHELIHKQHSGPPNVGFKQKMQLSLRDWLVNEITRLNEQVIMKNLENFQSGPIAFLSEMGIRSLAIIPLKSRSDTIGVICLFSLNSDHFKSSEANLLLNIGNRIAVAIEKAYLYEKVQAIAVLEERERISAELHDGLAQVLGYVITKSQATRQLLWKMTEANDYLVELENVAQEVYTDTREAILGLRTAVSGDRSMVSALREYVVRFNQMHNIKTELMVGDRIIPSLSPQVELQIIRIVQEALSNVRKHADATRVSITVDAGENEIEISVKDDGKGFDINKVGKLDWTKFGLRNMKERAESIHANFLVESRPENGTKVTLGIPLNSFQTVIKEGEEIESTDS